MIKPLCPSSVDNKYDGPLLTNTPQYLFITRAVKKFLSGSLIMNSRQLWNLHQRHKVLRTEASRDILEFRVSETPFPGVFKKYFSTTDAMLLHQQCRRNAPGVSLHDTVRTFHRSKPVQICVQCHSSSLFKGTYFLLAVMVGGDESSQLRMAN